MSSVVSKDNDIDVRFVDQQKINEFGKLNNRLLELRGDIKQYREDIEKLEDATAELMMAGDGDKVMIMIGESFVSVSGDEANEYCETKTEVRTSTTTSNRLPTTSRAHLAEFSSTTDFLRVVAAMLL